VLRHLLRFAGAVSQQCAGRCFAGIKNAGQAAPVDRKYHKGLKGYGGATRLKRWFSPLTGKRKKPRLNAKETSPVMKMSLAMRLFPALLLSLFVHSGTVWAQALHPNEVYTTEDGSVTIDIVSRTQLEISKGGVIILADFGFREQLLRVVYESAGQKIVEYFTVGKGVLRDKSGQRYFTQAALQAVAQERAQRGEAAKKGVTLLVKEVMIPVKEGCFNMGDTFGGGNADEFPVHKVCLDEYRIDMFEVAQAAYSAAMEKNPSKYPCPTCPVERVTWEEASAFCAKVGKRLPTEAEWEYAARNGGKDVKFAAGVNEVTASVANYGSAPNPKPVGSYFPNALGIFDMSGNVWEWVADWYDGEYYKNSPGKNPKGPATGTQRVLRGGAWYLPEKTLRASDRDKSEPGYRSIGGGFRCAK
jgi:formylglycine-generating enzyme required for sulfatase activity